MSTNPTPFPCGHMMGNDGTLMELCPALKRLKEEHIPLRKQMDEFYQLAREIGNRTEIEDWTSSLQQLAEKVARFQADLDPHSEREEDGLFPMMAKYIGRETGPIAVMEYEHGQAKENIRAFLEAAQQLAPPVDGEKAREVASYAVRAYQILSDHFMKEENVLFPMAQRMLSPAEKEELAEKIKPVAE